MPRQPQTLIVRAKLETKWSKDDALAALIELLRGNYFGRFFDIKLETEKK